MQKQESIDSLIKNKLQKDQEFVRYDSSYLFTTENINGYLPSVHNKSILTVASSGDHYFNAMATGAKVVDLFDINELTLYIIKLKKAAIERLDYYEFCMYFGIYNNTYLLNYKIYLKFRSLLDEDAQRYWDYLYRSVNNDGRTLFYTTGVFRHEFNNFTAYSYFNNYLRDAALYEELQRRLQAEKINFITSDINSLYKKLTSTYDYIFLSNIQDYQLDVRKFMLTIERLKYYLNDNGRIYFGYFYDVSRNELEGIYRKMLENYPTLSTQTITGFDAIVYNDNSQDKVYTLTKKI